jgi:DNA-binding transcriptional ArsR family regulator
MAADATADATQWIMALNHPLRRQILRTVQSGEVASATALCQRFDMPRSNVSYHVKVLADLDVLRLVRTRRVRGAKELFYSISFDGQAEWVRTILEDTRGSDSKFGQPLRR